MSSAKSVKHMRPFCTTVVLSTDHTPHTHSAGIVVVLLTQSRQITLDVTESWSIAKMHKP